MENGRRTFRAHPARTLHSRGGRYSRRLWSLPPVPPAGRAADAGEYDRGGSSDACAHDRRAWAAEETFRLPDGSPRRPETRRGLSYGWWRYALRLLGRIAD